MLFENLALNGQDDIVTVEYAIAFIHQAVDDELCGETATAKCLVVD